MYTKESFLRFEDVHLKGLISAKNEIATTGEPYKIQPKASGYFQI